MTTFKGAVAPSGRRPVAVVRDASRATPIRVVLLILQLLVLLLRFRPDIVLTTGAAPGLVAIRIARLLGAHTIWIDSVANSEELSLSGRLAREYVDLWLTQWPHLAERYPGLGYFGSVI